MASTYIIKKFKNDVGMCFDNYALPDGNFLCKGVLQVFVPPELHTDLKKEAIGLNMTLNNFIVSLLVKGLAAQKGIQSHD